jgi:hypothetical protein
MTDAHGRAHTRWTPNSKIGTRVLNAAVKGTEARTTFVLEAPEPAPTTVAKAPAVAKKTGKRASH